MKKILINNNNNKYDRRININKIKVNLAIRFLDFLKENEALDEFLNNFFSDSSLRKGTHRISGQEGYDRNIVFLMPHDMLNDIHFYLNNVNEMLYLNRAFVWPGTKERYSFWVNLADKWMNYVRDYWDLRTEPEEP